MTHLPETVHRAAETGTADTEATEFGAPLVIAQHGGHYGIGSFSSTEEHELKVSNKYLSWGWNSLLYKNIEEILYFT